MMEGKNNRISRILSSCTDDEVAFVRTRFLDEAESNPDLYDPIDVERCRTDEWTIKRFIAYRKHNLESASETIINSMRWRKENEASSLKQTDFPAEFFWVGECHVYGRDKNNVVLVFLRVKYHKPMSEFNPLIKKYLIWLMERMDEEIRLRGANGWALVYDCLGGTIFNNNMDLLMFMINTFFDNYPLGLTYIGLYELPWVLRAIYHICRGWMPEDYRELFVLLNSQTIHEHMGTENLPDYLGGTSSLPYRVRVDGCPSLRDMANKHQIRESTVDKFMNHYQKYLDEGDRQEKEAQAQRKQEMSNNNFSEVTAGQEVIA